MSVAYAVEKYMAAVDALATSDSPLRQRLAYAADPLIRLGQEDFPDDEMWKRHSTILEDI